MDQPHPETTLNQTILENQPSDHHSSPKRIIVVSESGTSILFIPSQTDIPQTDITHPPTYIQTQMEKYKIVLFDRLQNLVAERITTSDLVAYAAKWDSLTTFYGINFFRI